MRDETVRLLLVEDNPADARLVELGLAEAGGSSIEISRASRLSEARESLARGDTSIVLLDLNLPDSQGLSTLQEVLGSAAEVPVIVLTGSADEALDAAAVQEGAEDYLRKDELEGERLLRTVRYALERKRRLQRHHFLSDAVQTLASTLELGAVLRTVAHLTVPALADWCVVELLTESGELRALEIVASDERKEALLREKLRAYPHDPAQGRHPVDEVVRTRRAQLLPSVSGAVLEAAARDEHHLCLLRELAAKSLVIVPLIARERVLGTLSLAISTSDRVFDAADLELAEELALRAAFAVDNACRFSEARQAQQRAEQAADRSRHMESLAAALATAVTPQQVAAAALTHAIEELGATAGAVLIPTADGSALELMRAAGVPDALLPLWRRLPEESPSPMRDALRRGRIVAVADRAVLERRYPEFATSLGAFCAGGVVAVPLVAERRTCGVIVLVLARARRFSTRERTFLLRCAGKCAGALERAFLYEREQRAHAEAEKATQLRDEVLGIVAHDLRNPVAAINGYASLLREDLTTQELREQSLDGILACAQRMDRLIQDLLDVSRIDAGSLEVEPLPTAPDPLIREAVLMIEMQAREKELQVTLAVPPGLPSVAADRERVLQLVCNLLDNAVKFTPAGGTITVSAEALANEVLFRVSDSGPGIPAEQLPRLFDRFWQAKSSRRGGAGLGLAIARGIAEAHGGRIGAESQPGEGSCFFFTLPVQAQPGAREDTRALPAREPNSKAVPFPTRVRSARILLVDDHPMVRRGLREQLRRAQGFEVVGEAASGEEAVQKARLLRPDVVVMDLNMAGMDGIEATRRVLALDESVRVLALTAEAEGDVLLALLEAGASGFVHKTMAHQDLVPALETVLRDEVFLYPSGNQLLLREFQLEQEKGARLAAADLSRHEREVLALAAEGYTSPEIGKKLFLSPKTVDSYRSRAMRKLGLGSRPALVRFAVNSGLVTAN